MSDPNGPMRVTADCQDPVYNAGNFRILGVSEETAPSPHTKVIAAFAGTPYKVAIYLPSRSAWRGRFFQHVYPLQALEASTGDVAFALASGGYLVNTNGTPAGGAGYRVDAAAAKLAKAYAREFYQTAQPIYGYIWGGSGGSLQTIGAAENTVDVWQGAVAYVMATEASLVNTNAVAAMAGLALGAKQAGIADRIRPGGLGDPHDGLDAEERAAFDEALKMGHPLRAFDQPLGGPLLMTLGRAVRLGDPTYVDDFWTKPGHAGFDPPAFLQRAKIDHIATISRVTRDEHGGQSLELVDVPALAPSPGLEYWLYGATDADFLGVMKGKLEGSKLQLAPGDDGSLVRAVEPGMRVRINNRWYLALAFYHRHALPLGPGFYTYDQFRRPDGMPKYPQRSFHASRQQAIETAGGGTQTGKINSKLIVISNLLDTGAYPWQADWYAQRVRVALGDTAFADNFRILFNDNADHFDRPPAGAEAARLVNYVPSLHQALGDLVGWVEKGVAAPASTQYSVVEGQVRLPAHASARGGLQPVVDLTVNGGKRVEVAVNQPVTFRAIIEAPPVSPAGERPPALITSVDWWAGVGSVTFERIGPQAPSATIEVQTRHTYTAPGTYFVTVRAASQRVGESPAPAVENLDRVRVVVR